MLELITLGTLDIRGASGRDLSSVLSRPRRMALLVYLAVESRHGFVRRDALLPVFWPDMDQTRARKALRQALYVIRTALGDDVLQTRGAEEIAVSPTLRCDAVAMLEAGCDDALTLYKGDFLKGFFITDAPEFEQWLDDQRSTLRQRALDCAKGLAEQATDVDSAIEYVRRALQLAPIDENLLRKLVELYDKKGDRAAAIQSFDDFVQRLRREYEIEPDKETLRLLDQLKAKQPLITVRAPAPIALILEPAKRRTLFMTLGIGAVLAVAGFFAWPRTKPAVEARLLVMPFTVSGNPNVAYMSDAMAEMVGTNLDGAELYTTVSPGAVTQYVRDNGINTGDVGAAQRTARRFDAQSYIVGSVVELNGRVRVQAMLYRDSARPLARASITGSPDSLFALADRLAMNLIAESGTRLPADRLVNSAALTTHNVNALRAYIEGERAWRGGAFQRAYGEFARAVGEDSTFALAYYRQSMAAEWLSMPRRSRDLAEIATRHAQRLSTRDKLLLHAHRTMLQGKVVEAEKLYRDIVAKYPDDVEAWLKLGEIRYHNNPRRGLSFQEAAPPFRQALALDPQNRVALRHIAAIVASRRDVQALDSVVARYLQLAPDEGTLDLRALAASLHGDRIAFDSVLLDLRQARDAVVAEAATLIAVKANDVENGIRILEINALPSRGADRRALTHLQIAMLELSRGNWIAANSRMDEASKLDPVLGAQVRALVLMQSFVPATRADLMQLRTRIERQPPTSPTTTTDRIPVLAKYAEQYSDLRAFVLGALSVRLQDYATAERYVALVKDTELLHELRARLALAKGNVDVALREVQQISLDEREDLPQYLPNSSKLYVRAEVLQAAGRTAEAARAFSSFGNQNLFTYIFASK